MQATPKKFTMKKLVIAVGLLVVLNGCATITDTQATCQSSTYTFTDMVGCLNEQVRKNPSLVSNSLRTEYMAYANLLAEQVTYRQISDANARYQLAMKLAEGQRHEQDRRAKILEAYRQGQAADESQRRAHESMMEYQRSLSRPTTPTPTTTICNRFGNQLQCDTR